MYVKFVKRLLDIVFSLLALSVLWLPMLIVAVAIRLDTEGSPLFLQKRNGRNCVPFRIWKFRTLPTSVDHWLPTREFCHDKSQMTRLQCFLRMSSIDELPQLVNILKGDMSFVGPRPVICQEEDLIAARELCGANAVRPGLTGWAQINGRDDIDNVTKARLDGEYVERMSFAFDIKCLFLTVASVLRHDGYNDSFEADVIQKS